MGASTLFLISYITYPLAPQRREGSTGQAPSGRILFVLVTHVALLGAGTSAHLLELLLLALGAVIHSTRRYRASPCPLALCLGDRGARLRAPQDCTCSRRGVVGSRTGAAPHGRGAVARGVQGLVDGALGEQCRAVRSSQKATRCHVSTPTPGHHNLDKPMTDAYSVPPPPTMVQRK